VERERARRLAAREEEQRRREAELREIQRKNYLELREAADRNKRLVNEQLGRPVGEGGLGAPPAAPVAVAEVDPDEGLSAKGVVTRASVVVLGQRGD